MLTGKPWPNALPQMTKQMPLPYAQEPLRASDRVLNLAIVGLGPVGICAVVSLLDMLSRIEDPYVKFRIVAIDPNESRREKMMKVYNIIPDEAKAKGKGEFVVMGIEEAKEDVKAKTENIGCTGVLEVSCLYFIVLSVTNSVYVDCRLPIGPLTLIRSRPSIRSHRLCRCARKQRYAV